MSRQRVERLLSEIKKLKRQRLRSLKTCNKDTIHGICECIRNVIKGNVTLTNCQLNKLKPHKHSLRKLALKKTSLKLRKKILQRGGFLNVLLPVLVSGLTSLIGSFLAPSQDAKR